MVVDEFIFFESFQSTLVVNEHTTARVRGIEMILKWVQFPSFVPCCYASLLLQCVHIFPFYGQLGPFGALDTAIVFASLLFFAEISIQAGIDSSPSLESIPDCTLRYCWSVQPRY